GRDNRFGHETTSEPSHAQERSGYLRLICPPPGCPVVAGNCRLSSPAPFEQETKREFMPVNTNFMQATLESEPQNPYSPGKTGQKSFCFGHRFPHRFVSVQGGRVLWLVGCSGVPVDSSGDTPWRGGPPKGTTPPCRYSFERGSAA